MSSTAFAARFGIHRNTLPRYESGERSPTADFLLALCTEYNIQPNWLLLGREPKHWEDTGVTPAEKADHDVLSELTDLGEWLQELYEDNSKRKDWFEMELIDKIPLYKAWLKKRNQSRS